MRHKGSKTCQHFGVVSLIYFTSTEHRDHAGHFAEGFVPSLEVFCPWIGGDLQVFDINGDGYDDLICHRSTGQITISESHIVSNVSMDTTEGWYFLVVYRDVGVRR